MQNILTVGEKVCKALTLRGLGNLFAIVRENGGPVNAAFKLMITDDLKRGTHVGTDDYGNKYYQNNYYFFGRNRWVIYADHVGLNYDASQVPPEWYGWLHYKTDLIPSEDPQRPNYPWMLKHEENLSGTKGAYMCYSTGKPKIALWEPKTRKRT